MTPEAQNMALAEACEWTVLNGGKYIHPTGDRWRNLIVEHGDLNAEFEAWQKLTKEQKFAFRSFVQQVASRENIWAEEAQARFGCECLLRALGKWIE